MWRFATARAPGTSHIRSGLPCQDSLACSILEIDTLVAAVADGAGSAGEAALGARTVVQTVVETVTRALTVSGETDPLTLLTDAAIAARARLSAVAREQAIELRELASTLIAVISGPRGGAALQIGDGVIVVSEGSSDWSWAFWPQHGEYANTTHFLTDEQMAGSLQVGPLGAAVTDIALTTDGLERLALHYGSKSVYRPFFDGIFDPLHQARGAGEIAPLSLALDAFLKSERVSARTDDDVSIVLATRRRPLASATECD